MQSRSSASDDVIHSCPGCLRIGFPRAGLIVTLTHTLAAPHLLVYVAVDAPVLVFHWQDWPLWHPRKCEHTFSWTCLHSFCRSCLQSFGRRCLRSFCMNFPRIFGVARFFQRSCFYRSCRRWLTGPFGRWIFACLAAITAFVIIRTIALLLATLLLGSPLGRFWGKESLRNMRHPGCDVIHCWSRLHIIHCVWCILKG